MKKPIYYACLAFAFLAFMLAGCGKDSTPPPVANPIKFDAMAVGQKLHYKALLGYNYYSSTDTFVYIQDTLQLEIIGQDDKGFLVEERLQYTNDSVVWFKNDRDSIYHYYIRLENDTLRFMPLGSNYLASRIFENELVHSGLPLVAFNDQKVQINGWKTSLDYCECRRTAYAEDYTLFGKNYERLNILINNTAMALDGSGHTYMYSSSQGIARFSTYSWWTQNGYGWDLIPE